MADLDKLKADICEIGRRMYARQFVAANEGNISIRVDENSILCTPTLHCKGFLQPADICLVDLEGNQISGEKKRTSEVLLHIEIYKRRPDIMSVVHSHPPHVTAFAVAREPIPMGVLPEPDIFLGEVPIAPYKTPGNKEFAETILPFVDRCNTIVLANHGMVSFDVNIEKAYWSTEILDSYCRALILSHQLGHVEYLSPAEGKALLDLRKAWGMDDPRFEMNPSNGDYCDHPSFRATWDDANLEQRAFKRDA